VLASQQAVELVKRIGDLYARTRPSFTDIEKHLRQELAFQRDECRFERSWFVVQGGPMGVGKGAAK